MPHVHSLAFNEAIKNSLALATTKPHTEWVSLFDALGRTLAKEITCKKNLPSYTNAAMDGFAFTCKENVEQLRIKKTILAGDVVAPCLGENECYKIMTGAKVPEDADTVLPFEDAHSYDETNVLLPSKPKKGSALRLKGEEALIGTCLLSEGVCMTSREIALLASQGIMMVEVYKKLHIAIFSTGNELKSPWENANENEIYDINAISLLSLLKEHGFDAHYCGVVPDHLKTATAYFAQMKQYDVLLTSGGVSMGEADFVERALVANGFEASFHGINIKPGKPTMLGKMGRTLVASMPGNPLAAYVNAFVFVIPLLKKLQGQATIHFEKIDALNQEAFSMRSGRVNLVLGTFSKGVFHAFGKNKYGSGMVKPLIGSNALWISDEKTERVEAMEAIKIILF